MLVFRGTSTGWRNGLAGLHKIQEGLSPAPVHGGGCLAGKQLCTEGLRGGGTKLNVSQPCAFVANKASGIQGCIRSKDLNFLLYSSLVRPYLEVCVQFWTPQYRRDMELPERVHQMTTSMFKGLEHLSYEERLRELGMFTLEKKEPGGNSSMCINA